MTDNSPGNSSVIEPRRHDVIVADGVSASPELVRLREQAVAAAAAATLLDQRRRAAIRRSQSLEAASIRLRTSARTTFARNRLVRSHQTPRTAQPEHGLAGFRLEGVVDGETVVASWSEGRLHCDPGLYDRALFLVDLGERLIYTNPPREFVATLDGPPIAVALTLLRSCDRITGFVAQLTPPDPNRVTPA